MASEYEVLWSGAHRDVYLCVREPERLKVPPPRPVINAPFDPVRAYHSRHALKGQVLSLLRERRSWSVRELRETLQVDGSVLNALITRAVAAREIARVGFACVRIVYRRPRRQTGSAA